MPKSTVEGHDGGLYTAEYEGKKLLLWAGRIHRYEGYTGYKLNFIGHMSAFLGCQVLLVTCATGGCQKGMIPGTLSLITDYNNLTGINPLESKFLITSIAIINDPRFVDQKDLDPKKCFDAELIEIARECGKELKNHPDIKSMKIQEVQSHLFEGPYFWTTGPMYQSRSEWQFYIETGMNTIGMSTVTELLTAAAMGLRTLGIGMVADVMDSSSTLTHEQVLAAIAASVPILRVLLLEIIKRIKLEPEIASKIEAQINSKEEKPELPLIQPRGLVYHDEPEMKEVISFISKEMEQVKIKEFDYGCLFLNTTKTEEVLKYYENYMVITIGVLPKAPVFTKSSKDGVIIIGKIKEVEANCISICNLAMEGFRNFEAYFISRILKELKVPIVYTVITAEWLITGKSALLPIEGYFYRGYSNPVNLSSRLKQGSIEKGKVAKIIKRIIPSPYLNPLLFGFEGPIKPTRSEIYMAGTLKFDIYSSCSL